MIVLQKLILNQIIHHCRSLEPGTLYVITMIVGNTNNIQRAKSVNANTCKKK